jgi:hypothetical protein
LFARSADERSRPQRFSKKRHGFAACGGGLSRNFVHRTQWMSMISINATTGGRIDFSFSLLSVAPKGREHSAIV